jgi:hypothetical protein
MRSKTKRNKTKKTRQSHKKTKTRSKLTHENDSGSSKTKSIKRRGRQCRIKYMYIVAVEASSKSPQTLFLGSNDDAPIVTHDPQIWMICRPVLKKDEPQYYYIFDELGRILSHRICGDKGNVIMENNIDVKGGHYKWIIDNYKHKIIPYGNHLLCLSHNPKMQYGVTVRRQVVNPNQNPKWVFHQTWDFREKINDLIKTTMVKSKRARVWEFNQDDIDDIFVSHQKSKLLKFAQSLPNHGHIKVDESAKGIFCYIDMSHWDKYATQFREKIIEHYDFIDGASLYYFINKYYPFIVKHHSLTPKSKLYLATKLYKKGYHISLFKDSQELIGKKIKIKSIGLNHLVHRSYSKLLNEPQYNFPSDKFYGIAWFFIETDFKPPLTCFNSQMPIPHVSVGLILYEPSNESTIPSVHYNEDSYEKDISQNNQDESSKTFF